MSYLAIILIGMTLTMALGGCHCCGNCEYCDDGIDSLTIDFTATADACNGTGCDDISGTWELVYVEASTCCYTISGISGPCSTDDCDACVGSANDGSYCCNADGLEACVSRTQAVNDSIIPDCFTSGPEAAACGDTAGCSADTLVNDPGFTPTCASEPSCAGTFDNYDGMGYIDPGYSCTYPQDCECTGNCSDVALDVTSCLEIRDIAGTNHVYLVTTINMWAKTFENEEDLGAGDTVSCLSAISGLSLAPLTETSTITTNNLCNTPTATITANAA